MNYPENRFGYIPTRADDRHVPKADQALLARAQSEVVRLRAEILTLNLALAALKKVNRILGEEAAEEDETGGDGWHGRDH